MNSPFAYLVHHDYVLRNECSDANVAAQLTPMVSVYASRVLQCYVYDIILIMLSLLGNTFPITDHGHGSL